MDAVLVQLTFSQMLMRCMVDQKCYEKEAEEEVSLDVAVLFDCLVLTLVKFHLIGVLVGCGGDICIICEVGAGGQV